jgi:hypothetical protein
MKYSTVEDVLASFPHPILPPVEGVPDYQTIHANIKFLQANSRAIDTHLGGGTLGHLGLIVSDAAYSNIDPPTAEAPPFWVSPNAPGQAPSVTDGTAAKLSADLQDMHLRPARFEEANHRSLRTYVLGDLERQYGGLCQHLSERYVGPSLRDLWQHHSSRLGDQLITCAEHGIPIKQLSHSSNRFRIVLTIQSQEASPSVPHSRSMLDTHKSLQQGNS